MPPKSHMIVLTTCTYNAYLQRVPGAHTNLTIGYILCKLKSNFTDLATSLRMLSASILVTTILFLAIFSNTPASAFVFNISAASIIFLAVSKLPYDCWRKSMTTNGGVLFFRPTAST